MASWPVLAVEPGGVNVPFEGSDAGSFAVGIGGGDCVGFWGFVTSELLGPWDWD